MSEFTYSATSPLRPSVRVEVTGTGDRDVAFTLDDPSRDDVTSALAAFERLAGALHHSERVA